MRRILPLLILPLVAAVAPSQQPQPHISVWRTRLLPGGLNLVWSRSGTLDHTAWTLNDARGSVKLPPVGVARRGISNVLWNWNYHHGLTIPPSTRPGTYELRHKGIKVTDVRVDRPGTGKTRWASPELATSDLIERLADECGPWGTLNLLPGHYTLDKVIVLPRDLTIRGPGAVLHRTGEGAFFGVNHGDVFDSLTFQADAPAGDPALASRPIFQAHTVVNVTLKRCTVREKIVLGEFVQPGLLAEDCTFEHSSTGLVTAGAFVRCAFLGHPDPITMHPFMCWQSDGLALLDCDWRETDRGPIFQTTRGHIRNCLLSGCVGDGLTHAQGGGEFVAAENPQQRSFEFSDNLILHTRYRGDAHAFLIWDAIARRNLVRDLQADGGSGIWIAAWDRAEQADNELCEVELRGGQLFLGPMAKRTVLDRVVVVGPRQTRANGYHAIAPLDWPALVDESTDKRGDVTVRKAETAVER